MKILFISEFFPPDIKGGGEISTFLLAKYILKKNKDIEIHVLTSHNKSLKKYEEIEKIKIHRLIKTGNPNTIIGNIKRTKYKKSLLKNLLELEKKENFDLFHCFNITSIYAILLKEKIKKPFILHVNSPVLFCPKGTLIYQDKKECNIECNFKNYSICYLKSKNIGKIKLNPILKYNPITFFYLRKRYLEYKKLLKKFDYYVAISNYMKNKLLNENINEKKIQVIYNIIEIEKFKKEKNSKKNKKIKNNTIELEKLESEKSKQKNIVKILYLGEYSEPKGSKILFNILKNINKEFIANFYGDGILKKYLINEVKKNKLSEKIKINEKISHKEALEKIKEHDIVIIPSIVGEAFSRVAFEALYLKKIVIASNIGGIKDIINQKTGFLYNNEEELKKLILKAINNELEINKNQIEKHVKTLINYEKLINIYEKLKIKN